jgi:inward rectifier potassium channel
LGKLRRTRKDHKSHVVRFGHREIETLGLDQGFWTDLYHRSMTVYWPVFFGSAAAIFIALNSIFAILYSLGTDPIANVTSKRYFIELFYFSIETLATVGYGDMHPQTDYGHFIATIEIFTGMCFLAVLTGLVFARFSRPRARFVFANFAVVTMYDGRSTLMIRMANARHNTISRATARLWIIRAERADGEQLRRFHELKLYRNEHPMFALSWTLFHAIDKDSPLYSVTEKDISDSDAIFVLNVSGIDDASAQQLYARHVYSYYDIRWNHRYRDITSVSPQGRFQLDYTKFDDTVPDGA